MKEKSSTSRASQSAVGTAKERPSSKLDKKEKVVMVITVCCWNCKERPSSKLNMKEKSSTESITVCCWNC